MVFSIAIRRHRYVRALWAELLPKVLANRDFGHELQTIFFDRAAAMGVTPIRSILKQPAKLVRSRPLPRCSDVQARQR